MSAVRFFGAMALLVPVLFFAGCAGAPAPVTEGQAPKAEEAAGAKAAEDEKVQVPATEQMPVKVVAPQAPSTAQYWSEALIDYEDGEFKSALESVVKVRRDKPDYPGARQLETKLRYQVGDAGAGLPLLEEMVKRSEGGAGAIHTYANWSAQSGRTANAQNVLEKLIGTGDDADPDQVAALAWLYQSVGDEGEAYQLYSLIEGRPQAETFISSIVRARFDSGDYEGVRELFDRNPKPLQVRLAMADVNRMEGRASAAEQGYVQVLEGAPQNYWAKVNLAILKLGQGNAAGARTLLEQVSAEHPDRPEVWCNLGLTLRKLGEHDEALKAYNKALEVDPNHPMTLKNIGILWEKYFGEPATGLDYYGKYLEIVGDDKEVQRWHKAATRLVGSAK